MRAAKKDPDEGILQYQDEKNRLRAIDEELVREDERPDRR